MQIVLGVLALTMFIGAPMVFVWEALGNELPAAVFILIAALYLSGIILMYRVKCPDCGALITSVPVFFSSSVKTYCSQCNRSTSAPYVSDD